MTRLYFPVLYGEQLGRILACLEFQRIAGRIEQVHCPLLTWLAREADVWLDDASNRSIAARTALLETELTEGETNRSHFLLNNPQRLWSDAVQFP